MGMRNAARNVGEKPPPQATIQMSMRFILLILVIHVDIRSNMKRHKNGKFRYSSSNFSGLKLMLLILITGALLELIYTPPQTPPSPLSPQPAEAIESLALPPVVVPPAEPKTQKQEIMEYIIDKWGDDADKMITIIGTCENGTWDQSRVNHNSNGSTDYGIAQVNDLNGARDKQCKGLDYRNSWKDNLDCAHIIYKSQGFKAWACSDRVGIVPFYMRSK